MSDFESKPPRVGLWANDRGPMASGNCGSIRFVLWDNRSRKKGNEPDFHLVLEQSQPREKREPQGGPPAGGGGLPDDEIPF